MRWITLNSMIYDGNTLAEIETNFFLMIYLLMFLEMQYPSFWLPKFLCYTLNSTHLHWYINTAWWLQTRDKFRNHISLWLECCDLMTKTNMKYKYKDKLTAEWGISNCFTALLYWYIIPSLMECRYLSVKNCKNWRVWIFDYNIRGRRNWFLCSKRDVNIQQHPREVNAFTESYEYSILIMVTEIFTNN